MNSIEQYAYHSPLCTVDPRVKITVSMSTLFVTIGCYHIITSLIVLALTMPMIIIVAKVRWRDYLAVLSVPITFILLSAVTLAFSYSQQPVGWVLPFFGGYLCLTQSGISLALTVTITALAATQTLFFMMFTTPLIDLLYALKKWRCPSVLITLMTLTYKFIFILITMSHQMYLAQYARLGYQNIKHSYHSIGHIASTLFIRAIKKTGRMVDALESRAYQGDFMVLDLDYLPCGYLLYGALIIDGLLLLLYVTKLS